MSPTGLGHGDVEKNPVTSGSFLPEDGHAVPGYTFEYGNSTYARLQRLAGKLHVEQRGIERVPEDERNDTSLLNVGTMWLSCNMVVSSFALGMLAQKLFYLGFVDAVLTCIFFNLLGVAPVCYFSTFGPRFGLRQVVLSRYWFGWYGVKIIAFFNMLACIGWSSVNSIVGGELIHAVNNDVPGYAGIIIIAICTLIITFFGYKVVHAYEYWSWIPTFIVFLIILGTFAHSGDFVNIPMGVGLSEIGSVLSFGCVIYGFATGWACMASDYTVYQPATQSRRKIFGAVWLGLMFPLLFTQILGIAIMTATTINDGDNRYMQGYESAKVGGLLAAVLFPPLGGFGKFCLVILALSTIANNCPNVYSVGLTLQVLGRWTQRIPRYVLTTIGTAAYIAIAIPAYTEFEEVLENFMNFIGYWLAIYEGIAFSDHFLYKRSMSAYDPSLYDQPSKLPPGIAAIFAFCCGIVGMVMGMSQVWFVGPIALHAGEAPFGGDVGFELGFAFAFVAYTITRHFELKYFGR
ncbi:purine-cytosine permease [Aaosphaeria arxii CBS 175.79]|uniref:Purine-cytosine permease n=1 Tax=Aaosphaeria arxii CBS 175.79 TaxID=1450172 RepID=A0A6A5XCM5_9PLEO|nr:purine-cytosine permease [Aaosphaeria arxii CBS 175.79]KAF2010566.1 purine-cytosine permease [Aaosphaeria arxii CBS 175.79]